MPMKRQTLTLLEVMVVLFLAITLLVCLQWYIGSSRERVRRISCLSNLKQIGLSCHLYAADWRGAFPFAVGADDSNDHFYLLLPNYMTTTSPFVCPSDYSNRPRSASHACREAASDLTKASFDIPNVNSYFYVAGLTDKSSRDSPLAGDNLADVSKANDPSVPQYQKRVTCSTKGSDHDPESGNVLFVDGHAAFGGGTLWVDGAGGTKNIKNPNGL